MGFKSLFVREDPTPTRPISAPIMEEDVAVEVNGSEVLSPDEIYSESGISGSDGIYKASGFIDAAPPSLDSIGKKKLVQDMLAAASMDVDDLFMDAQERMSVLDRYGQGAVDYFNSETERINGQIAELHEAVEMLKSDLATKERNTQEQVRVVKDEISRLKTLQSYVERESV